MIYTDSDCSHSNGFIAHVRRASQPCLTWSYFNRKDILTIKAEANKSDLVSCALILLTFPFEDCWKAVEISV